MADETKAQRQDRLLGGILDDAVDHGEYDPPTGEGRREWGVLWDAHPADEFGPASPVTLTHYRRAELGDGVEANARSVAADYEGATLMSSTDGGKTWAPHAQPAGEVPAADPAAPHLPPFFRRRMPECPWVGEHGPHVWRARHEDGETYRVACAGWSAAEPNSSGSLTGSPARQADEIRAAIVNVLQGDLSIAHATAEVRAFALMDRVVGPLIAERDRRRADAQVLGDLLREARTKLELAQQAGRDAERERDEQRQRAERAEAELAHAREGNRNGQRAMDERDATIRTVRADLLATQDRAHRADATIAELHDQVENRTCERDLENHARLAAEAERDRLREADARVRKLHRPWDEHADYCRECSCESPVPMPCPTLAALDGTDVGES